jgi:hypothetical protein
MIFQSPSRNSLEISRILDPWGALLIGLNTLLLGIWILKETIALRNILLVSGFIVAIFYVARLHRNGQLDFKLQNQWLFLPVLLIPCLFAWMVFHYFFLSLNPVSQLQELQSTWFRGLLAWVMGVACALAIIRAPQRITWLALGVLSNFIGLLIEYLPLAIAQKKLSHVKDVLQNYLQGKIYAVVLGSLYFGGLLGLVSGWVDRKNKISGIALLFWFSGLALIFYSYIYIVDTRNGTGIAVLLFITWLFWALFFIRKNASLIGDRLSGKKLIFIFCITFTVLMGAVGLQLKQNKGWYTTLDDALIAVQIDRYHHWQNPPNFGYPPGTKHANTYERAAWFMAAITLVPDRPLGDGTLKYAFGRAVKDRYPESNVFVSHSPWLDFALGLGVPGILLLLGSFLSALILSFKSKSSLTHYVRWITLAILMAYTFAELTNQAAFEFLLYMAGFLPSLLFSLRTEQSCNIPSQ